MRGCVAGGCAGCGNQWRGGGVVGLNLDPPEKAIVLAIDEKSQIQEDRTAPILPLRPGLPEKATHDDVRHGTTTLFAALEVATGTVTDACYPRHRSDEFLRFLKQLSKAYSRVPLHLVVDNYTTHKHPNVQAWLARNPRITMHFTPTSGSWLNMVEIFFSIMTRQAIRRGTFTSVKDLIVAIEAFIDGWNERCHPFSWTKTADEILTKARGGQKNIIHAALGQPSARVAVELAGRMRGVGCVRYVQIPCGQRLRSPVRQRCRDRCEALDPLPGGGIRESRMRRDVRLAELVGSRHRLVVVMHELVDVEDPDDEVGVRRH
jgi:transposase